MMYTLVAALVAGLAMGGAGAWQVQAWRQDSHEAARVEAAQEQHTKNERAAAAASAAHEKDKTDEAESIRIVRVEVDKIVERPVYLRECFDADGMRALARALGGADPAGQPSDALPAAGAAR